MSTTVDERVVKMEFENKNFEKSAKTSINTINKLKESLNFNNIVTVLTNSLNLLNKTDLSSISKEVESVKVSFSALQIVAATALSNCKFCCKCWKKFSFIIKYRSNNSRMV